jgi:hypothetical protein
MTNPLRGLSKNMKAFIKAVVAGEKPQDAVARIYPQCKDSDVRVATLFANPKVQHAIDVLTEFGVNRNALKIQLNAVLNDPKAAPRDKNAAVKLLRDIGKDHQPVKPKFPKHTPLRETDTDLQEKMQKLHLIATQVAH